jgi:hypothetical protein
MENKIISIQRENGEAKLVFNIDSSKYEIDMSSDNVVEIKLVFNAICKELEKGKFIFELEDDKKDLYNDVAKEYIGQLNDEMADIFAIMKNEGIVKAGRIKTE